MKIFYSIYSHTNNNGGYSAMPLRVTTDGEVYFNSQLEAIEIVKLYLNDKNPLHRKMDLIILPVYTN